MNIIPGIKIGRLTTLRISFESTRKSKTMWACDCDCGEIANVSEKHLSSEATKSCGCLKREALEKSSKTHGLSKTPEYKAWMHMRGRCHTPTDGGYYKYGARGISVCTEWRKSFLSFYKDMGPRPSASHSLHRINNDGDYSPENCEWATIDVQANVKRSSITAEWKGKTRSLAQICKMVGIVSYATANARVYVAGWSVEDAVLIPANGYRHGRTKHETKHQKGSMK